ncbi:DUF1800 domain-containing protein [Catenovulum sp. 2E275]|uniref:DUF1800 domain-containing protein n=1 Tax=Catenovulum sp. 2E275 TaxID=2980497 RepID=UPI0021D2850F|nr:DUF1800 domain-containing protein [Catenovulum sp. 2E275]MCU4677144.1 DUF1800 domain-containing protein [Catenovulum sp. 2E275]
MYNTEIALNRFGYGALQNQLNTLQSDPKKWLLNQLKPMQFTQVEWTSIQAIHTLAEFQLAKEADKKNAASQADNNAMQAGELSSDKIRKKINQAAKQTTLASLQQIITQPESFQSRLLDFFSNHFSVSANNIITKALAPTLEREAIAPNLVGQFSDLLLAVIMHPAMLVYLNNEKSIGPDSKVGKKRSEKGLNENLAREILELHTLGVNAGYSQQDVRELAMAITGWTVTHPYKDKTEHIGFIYKDQHHQPGARFILGKSYPQVKLEQGKQILIDLAEHPATAKHISFKLARHFIADEPDPALVSAMSQSWIQSKGNLAFVLTAMIEHPASWQPKLQKLKTPRDFVISACRACNQTGTQKPDSFETLKILGQMPFSAGSPAGFGDTAAFWNGSEALLAKIEWADRFSRLLKNESLELIKQTLGRQLSANSEKLINQAESKQQAIALFLMSPEFQLR